MGIETIFQSALSTMVKTFFLDPDYQNYSHSLGRKQKSPSISRDKFHASNVSFKIHANQTLQMILLLVPFPTFPCQNLSNLSKKVKTRNFHGILYIEDGLQTVEAFDRTVGFVVHQLGNGTTLPLVERNRSRLHT